MVITKQWMGHLMCSSRIQTNKGSKRSHGIVLEALIKDGDCLADRSIQLGRVS